MNLFKNKSRLKTSSDNGNTRVVWYSIFIYVVVFSCLSILKYESFSASLYDLGIMIQTVWNTSKGWILQESINMGTPMMRFWMAHWEFIYLPVALIYKIFPSPYTILIVQTIVLACGALPVYWLAREKLNNQRIAALFSIGYLLNPAIQNANLCDVHGVTFAATFLLFAFYFLQKKSLKNFIIFGLLALMSREDAALVLLMMGAYAFIIMKEKKLGMAVSIISLLWFIVWYKRMTLRAWLGLPEFVIMEGAEAHWDHLKNISSDPLYIIKFLAKKYNIRYFFYLFGPMAFISFFSPTHLLLASPILAINLLSSYYYTHEVEHYYSVIIAGFIVVAAIYGLKNISAFIEKRRMKKMHVAVAVLLYSLFFFFIKSNVFDAKNWNITTHHKIIKKVIESIPPEASVSAENTLAVHAAERHELYAFDENVDKVDYVLYDFYAPSIKLITRKSFVLPSYWPDNQYIRNILSDQSFGIIKYENGVCLFKRDANYDDGITMLAGASNDEIVNPLNRKIGDAVFCRGYNKHNTLSYYIQPDKLGAIQWKKAIHFTFYWTSKGDLPDNLKMFFKFQNENHEFVQEHAPVFDLLPPHLWNWDELVRDELFWAIPDEASPGFYQVSVALSVDPESIKYSHLFNVEIE